MGRGAVETSEAVAPATAAEPVPDPAPAPESRRSSRPTLLHLGTVVVLVVGLLLTATLAFGSQSLHTSNENRLLRQREREAAAVIAAAVPNLQTPLASAAELAEATNANPVPFKQLMTPQVQQGRFISASLWSLAGPTPRRLVTVGVPPALASTTPAVQARILGTAVKEKTVAINDLLQSNDRRIGYAYAAPTKSPTYVVYTETALPKSRRAKVDTNSAFSDLDYALYLGDKPADSQLMASSTGGALLKGETASGTVPFGDSHLLLVMSARSELGGDLLARLPWSLAIAGVLLTLAGAFLVERLLRRRDHAEALAQENDELYKEQRSVAQMLQHSLLPTHLPHVGGLELGTRYVAGVEGIDIGGDWYDVIKLDDNRIVFVVGDVSGRGLRAATTMAELRYAVRAYAVQGDAPEVILTKVSQLIDVVRDGHFATAVCGVIDVAGHVVTLANAGHPNPMLIAGDRAQTVSAEVGVPLGVEETTRYNATTVSIPPTATLLVYTDGLIERRGENLDVGIARLKEASLDTTGTMDDLLTRLLAQTIPAGSADDTAILGLRWQN